MSTIMENSQPRFMDNVQPRQISIKDTKEVVCPCGSVLFKSLVSVREISEILSGTGQKEYRPIEVIVCNKCEKPFERSRLIAT